MSESQFSRGGAEFTVELFRKLKAASGNENIIVSPLSLQACMALAFAGAKGETASEIASGMKYHSTSHDQVAQEFHNVLSGYDNSPLVKIANKIYVQQGKTIKPEYASVTKEQYHSESESVNFADAEKAVQTINSWVEHKTAGKINQIVTPDTVDGSTSVVLVNAIHFKGLWQEAFDPESTIMDDFWIGEDKSIQLPFMYSDSHFSFGYFDNLHCQAVELPYKDSDLSMFIIKPNQKGGLHDLAKQLKDIDLLELSKKMQRTKMVVRLPKFKIEYSLEASNALQEMGIKKAFSGAADFSNILEPAEGLSISQVIHKAVIEVNEEGTEAAAATCVPMGRCMPMQFDANYPFFYWIWNKKTVLFAGAFVTAPAKA